MNDGESTGANPHPTRCPRRLCKHDFRLKPTRQWNSSTSFGFSSFSCPHCRERYLAENQRRSKDDHCCIGQSEGCNKINKLQLWKKWEDLGKSRHKAYSITKFTRSRDDRNVAFREIVLPPIQDALRRVFWKAMWTLISMMESYKSCWLHHYVPKELLGDQMGCIVFTKTQWAEKSNAEFCARKRQSVEFEWNFARRQCRSLAESNKIRTSQDRNSCGVIQKVHRWFTKANGSTR